MEAILYKKITDEIYKRVVNRFARWRGSHTFKIFILSTDLKLMKKKKVSINKIFYLYSKYGKQNIDPFKRGMISYR
jgi:hypothetical protein